MIYLLTKLLLAAQLANKNQNVKSESPAAIKKRIQNVLNIHHGRLRFQAAKPDIPFKLRLSRFVECGVIVVHKTSYETPEKNV